MKKRILLSLILGILITICPTSYSAVLLDRIVAIVNNDIITWSELRGTIEMEARMVLEGLEGEAREQKIQEIRKTFLNTMLDIKLQIQEAQKAGLSVGSAETESAIVDIKKKYNLTEDAFIGSLRAEGLDIVGYKEKLSEQILISKVVRQEVSENIFISDSEVKEYYETHKEQYLRKERVKIRQIFFSRPEDDILKSEIETRAEEISRRIQDGESFERLAREVSEDASREFGGDLGYISRGSVLKEVEDVAFNLDIGEVSRPFWSTSGLHIVKLEDRIESSKRTEAKEKIKEILFEEVFQSKFEDWVKALREKAYIKILL
ncbi:MAG: peptidylprolyl isomerase [Nitrospiraceae bacterium]|nr:MAG: peptidylprolyl isomerase [Nitrospiraceae bacterium]